MDDVWLSLSVSNDSIVASTGDILIAVDAKTGKEQWRFVEPESLIGRPSIADGRVYVYVGIGIPWEGTSVLVSLEATDGAELWRTYLAGPTGPEVATPVVVTGMVFGVGAAPYSGGYLSTLGDPR